MFDHTLLCFTILYPFVTAEHSHHLRGSQFWYFVTSW